MVTMGDSTDVELKVRIPRGLLRRVDAVWHQQELKNRKAPVVVLLEEGLLNGKGTKQAEKSKTD
jgi:hypothetical protein